jgi:uncharacterized membrane protein HdeD (DUF308 family)
MMRVQSRDWPMMAVRGVVALIFGILALVWPAITASVLLYIIALRAIITGVLETTAAIQFRRTVAGGTLLSIAGVISFVFGLLLFARPMAGALAMVMLIGVFGLVYGVLLLAFAFLLRGGTRAVA